MVRPFLATLGLAALAAWIFSPSATGAPGHSDFQAPTPGLGEKSPPAALPNVAKLPPSSELEKSAGTLKSAGLSESAGLSRSAGVSKARLDVERRSADSTPGPAVVAYPKPMAEVPTWVTAAPAPFTQHSRTSRERGVNPCMAPDPGFGDYGVWDRSPSIGQMIVPKDLVLNERGEFPVVIHFHGHEPARKAWVQAIKDAVLVGIDLGNNSGPYLRKFAQEAEFDELLTSIETGVAHALGNPRARIGKLGISSWSAGYGAVERALRSSLESRIDAVILLDGLHTGHANTDRAKRTLEPFVARARHAAQGQGLMFVSHSSIVPPTYASTTETASYLIWQLGGQPRVANERADDPMGLQLFREFSSGDFHVRGFTGSGKQDHCAHLGLYERVLRERLAPRWGLSTVKAAH